ncbi:MAG: hypothetical protein CL816_00795 [Coxiellaceae bacterium]|nr:hypothetical protein [Coxiellaceae bacterium]
MPDDTDDLELSGSKILQETFIKSLLRLMNFYQLEGDEIEKLASEAHLSLKNNDDMKITEQVDDLFHHILDADLSSFFKTNLPNGKAFLAYLWRAVGDSDKSTVTSYLIEKTELLNTSRLYNEILDPVDYKRMKFVQLFNVLSIQRPSVNTDDTINATVLCALLKNLSDLHPMIFITDCQDTLKMEIYRRFNQSIDQIFDEVAPDQKKPIYRSWIAYKESQHQYVECLIDFESRKFIDDMVFIKIDWPNDGEPAWYYRQNLVKWMKSHGTSPISNREITHEDITTHTDYVLNKQPSELTKFIDNHLNRIACSLVSEACIDGFLALYIDYSQMEYPDILSQLADLLSNAINLQARSSRPIREKVILSLKRQITEFSFNEGKPSQQLCSLKNQLSVIDTIDNLIADYLKKLNIKRRKTVSDVSLRVKWLFDIFINLCDQVFTGLLSDTSQSMDEKYKQYDQELSSFWMQYDAFISAMDHCEQLSNGIEISVSNFSLYRDLALTDLKDWFYSDSFVIFSKDMPLAELTGVIQEKTCIIKSISHQLKQIVDIDKNIDRLRQEVYNPLLFPKIHKCKTAWIAVLYDLYKDILDKNPSDSRLLEEYTLLFDLMDQVSSLKRFAISHHTSLPPQLLHQINTIETWMSEIPPIVKKDTLDPEIVTQLLENISNLHTIYHHIEIWKKINLSINQNHNTLGDDQTKQQILAQVTSRLLLYYSDKLASRPDLSDLVGVIDFIDDFEEYERICFSNFEKQHRWTRCFCLFDRSMHQRFNEMMGKRYQRLLDQFTNYFQSQSPSNLSNDTQYLRECLKESSDHQSTTIKQSIPIQEKHPNAMSITY